MKIRITLMAAFGLILYALTTSSCSSSHSKAATSLKSQKKVLPKPQFFVDLSSNGTYEKLEIEEKPIPVQGNDQWTRDFYRSIKYPPNARRNSIQGIVILDVTVDNTGKVSNVAIKKGLSQDCDEEAKRAFISSTKNGYSPLRIDSNVFDFKMELPVGFWLQ